MTETEKIKYLEKHLGHELRLLLSAVGTWQFLKVNESGFVVNIARDSVCVHFRTLLTFFISEKSASDISITEFGVQPFKSKYKYWLGKINEAVLHVSPSRGKPKNYPPEDLNDQMDYFKVEILRLWEEFILALPKNESLLRELLILSNSEACRDIERLKKSLQS